MSPLPPPLRSKPINWMRHLLGMRQKFRSGNAVFEELDTLPLMTALAGRGTPRGYKDYRVTFDDGHSMVVRQTRERSFADIRGKTELFHYERIAHLLEPGLHVLDAACGTGYGSEWLMEKGMMVTSLDLGQDATTYAHHRYPVLQVVRGSVEALPLVSDTFDWVVSVETIEHIPDAPAYVAEVERILKPGGKWYVTTPVFGHCGSPYHVKEYTREEFVELLSASFPVQAKWNWIVDDGAWMELVLEKI